MGVSVEGPPEGTIHPNEKEMAYCVVGFCGQWAVSYPARKKLHASLPLHTDPRRSQLPHEWSQKSSWGEGHVPRPRGRLCLYASPRKSEPVLFLL